MVFRIQTSVINGSVTFSLSGQLDVEGVSEIQRLLNNYRDCYRFVFDLKDIRLVDRYAIKSLTAFERGGVELVNSPTYVRDWMLTESGPV